MIQLSEFFQHSFVLILKGKCLVRTSRVRSGESGTPSTIIYTRWSSRRYELGCDTPMVRDYETRMLKAACSRGCYQISSKMAVASDDLGSEPRM